MKVDMIDLDYFAKHGVLSQADAQGIHTHLLALNGVKDGDAVIADWNRRSPEALWDAGGTSAYVDELSDLAVRFMMERIEQGRAAGLGLGPGGSDGEQAGSL